MATNQKHTPGPWILADGLGRAEFIQNKDGVDLVMMMDGASVADMRLMAAAPELFSACSAWVAYLDRDDEFGDADQEDRLMEAMRVAIAKATGESTNSAGRTTKGAPC